MACSHRTQLLEHFTPRKNLRRVIVKIKEHVSEAMSRLSLLEIELKASLPCHNEPVTLSTVLETWLGTSSKNHRWLLPKLGFCNFASLFTLLCTHSYDTITYCFFVSKGARRLSFCCVGYISVARPSEALLGPWSSKLRTSRNALYDFSFDSKND